MCIMLEVRIYLILTAFCIVPLGPNSLAVLGDWAGLCGLPLNRDQRSALRVKASCRAAMSPSWARGLLRARRHDPQLRLCPAGPGVGSAESFGVCRGTGVQCSVGALASLAKNQGGIFLLCPWAPQSHSGSQDLRSSEFAGTFYCSCVLSLALKATCREERWHTSVIPLPEM